uniref:Arginyl-tRNA--protein transferase 1 n=1 Tax=Steinernema glaseri TaxID=37863 RepID=A0A1I7ZA10_9BILA
MTASGGRTRGMRNSIVELFDSSSSASTCGYCKGMKALDGRQKENRGMMAFTVSNAIFNDLLDRGWSRSGRYVYKPIMAKTCCPQYTIRLDVTQVRLSRMQKRVLRNMNRFLAEDKKPSRKEVEEVRGSQNGCSVPPKKEAQSATPAKEKLERPISDPDQPVKKKEMRRKRCFAKLAAKGIDIEAFKRQRAEKEASRTRTISSFILPYDPTSHKHKLEVRLVREGSQEFNERYDEEVDLYLKYQKVVHNDHKATRRGFDGFLANSPLVYEAGDDRFPGFGSFHQLYLLDDKIVAFKRQRAEKEASRIRTISSFILPYDPESHKHKLEVRLVREGSQEFKERYDEEVDLYFKYQKGVHNDHQTTRDRFDSFLVNSPLFYEAGKDGFPGFGSFHQLYLLDDKIVAVGVLDLLPTCLSSTYFFYDPDYSFLALGTYSALREIEFTQRMHVKRPLIQYYNMGCYIEGCPKMEYKRRYYPSYLMCDKTFKWMPIEEAIDMIRANENRFTEFFPQDERPTPPSLDDVRIIWDDPTKWRSLVSAPKYKMKVSNGAAFEKTIAEFVDLAGPVATKICIYRPPGSDEIQPL